MKVVFLSGNDFISWDKYLWIKNLRNDLIKLGFEVVFETMPDSILARKEYWFKYLERVGVDSETVLIGFSSGAVCAMRWAEFNLVLGLVLISPCYTDTGCDKERASGYFDDDWNWSGISSNIKFSLVFSSLNDDFICQNEFDVVCSGLGDGCESFKFEELGHFNSNDFERIPFLVGSLSEKLDSYFIGGNKFKK